MSAPKIPSIKGAVGAAVIAFVLLAVLYGGVVVVGLTALVRSIPLLSAVFVFTGWLISAAMFVVPVVAVLWLWTYWKRPPQARWSRLSAGAAALLIATATFYESKLLFILVAGRMLRTRFDIEQLDGLIVLMLTAVALPAALGTLLALLAYRKLRSLVPPGHCSACGYDLTGNTSGVCPECGAAAPVRALEQSHA
ncbi:MAG TPA: hypothetical protein VGM03_00555 [Phycisphaerae bacterium]